MAADDSYTAADERARAARRAGIQAKKDEQPANTARSYAAKQREWKAWCHTPRAAADGSLYSWPDGELVTPDKLAAWLKEDILLRRVVPPQKKKPRARTYRRVFAYEGTIDAYIAAVIELWRLQVAHGNSNTENPGAPPPRERRDPGRLPHDEWLRIQDLLLTGAAYTPQNLRTRVDLLFGHYYLLRGENRRKMELADLSLLDYPPSEGPTPVVACSSLALARRRRTPPSFRRRQDWYRIKVLVGRDREQELSYPTQLQETWRIFGAAGLIASKKTHLPRRVGAQDAETHGTSLAQISQAGRWNQSVLCQAYLTHLPRQFMPVAVDRGVGTRFEARARRQCWAEGGLDDDDLAADGFLKLMRRLRIVLLQDLAVLQLRYPSLPFFAYAPFSGPEWDEFAVAVRSTAVGAMETVSLLVRRALPELSGVIESTREALLQNSQRLAIRLEARLDGIQGGLDALLQGKVPITFTGYFGAGSAEALAPAPAPAPSTVPTLNLNTAPAPAPDPEPLVPGMPIVTALARVFTVGDVWKEWEEGVQFCRRKVIWDELLARMASGKCKEAAVAELELLRAGRSLNRLVDELKQRRRRGQDRGQGQARYGYR
ncbi:centromere DNA-binding protein complex CBF3 subunit [Hirsutella rhossiliensis]|uniref:Centromere DNA-binding protein complex CBF3 subunit n=1 Tax=Hirsutella rhossiliensis TaxID=111463 RepID=A0A9P8MPV9_9HYPO|nr:centromere DNA-binding protein complex CBF3 subunit [Hirsutella rhossiliensis]KAH0959252.1 centromere DNA-binding protein complex CBF3 subunit [Hirsutella rhossiliensis]